MLQPYQPVAQNGNLDPEIVNGAFTCVCTDRSMEQITEVRAAQQEKLGLRGQTLFVYI